MNATDLESHYRGYIACLNSRRWDELHNFVNDSVTYNNAPKTRAEYADMISADVAAADELVFDVKLLVVSGNTVACRLEFECTPIKMFLGLKPTGRRVVFAENVFYRFVEGRVAEVWSLIDRDAVREQLSG